MSKKGADNSRTEIHLESPVSLRRVLRFAGLSLLIQIVSTLGFLAISVLGGLVSSAGTSAAAANMVGHGQMQAGLAGEAVVLASVASALVNLPISQRNANNPVLLRRLAVLTFALSGLGIAVLVVEEYGQAFRI